MKTPKVVFVCQECGAQAPKWMGRCAECGAWNSLVEERAETPVAAGATNRFSQFSTSSTAKLYAEVEMSHGVRLSTGIDEFDRVLGGGVVPGSLILLGGEPGIGKSTLLLQAASEALVFVSVTAPSTTGACPSADARSPETPRAGRAASPRSRRATVGHGEGARHQRLRAHHAAARPPA